MPTIYFPDDEFDALVALYSADNLEHARIDWAAYERARQRIRDHAKPANENIPPKEVELM